MLLSRAQKCFLAAAILEMPLQIDTYLHYQKDVEEFGVLGGFNVSLLSFCVIGMYVTWLGERKTHADPGRRNVAIKISAYLYFMAVAFSILVAENSLFSLFELALLGQTCLLFFFLIGRVCERRDLLFVMTIVAVAVAFQGMVVLGSQVAFSLWGVRELDLKLFRIAISDTGRSGGTLASPNILGSYLATLIIPVSSLMIVSKSRATKGLALVGVLAGGVALVTTQSRGSILAAAIACVVFGVPMFLRGWMPRWVPALVVCLTIVVSIPLYQVIQQRVLADDDGAAVSRVHLSKIASEIISDHLLLGVGAGNYHLVAHKYANMTPFRSEWFQTVHSKYLLVWAETGLIGLTTFLTLILVCLKRGWSAWKVGDHSISPLALALVAGLVGHLVHFSVDRFNDRPTVQTLWLSLALLVCTTQVCTVRQRGHQRPSRGQVGPPRSRSMHTSSKAKVVYEPV